MLRPVETATFVPHGSVLWATPKRRGVSSMPARGRVAVEAGAVPGGHARGWKTVTPSPRRGGRRRGAEPAALRAVARELLLAERRGRPAGDVAAVAASTAWCACERPGAGRRRRGAGRATVAARRRGAGRAAEASPSRPSSALRGRADERERRRPAPAGGRAGRRRSAPRRTRSRAARRRGGEHGRSRGSGTRASSGFLRCLRGELTGSRRESSATAGHAGRFAPRIRRPQWVPRSPREARRFGARQPSRRRRRRMPRLGLGIRSRRA